MSYYYNVWVNTKQFRSSSTLTYSYGSELIEGTIVLVPFRNKTILGLVEKVVSKPEFEVRPIAGQISDKSIPKNSMSLLEWLIDYYPSSSSTHLQLFLPAGIDKIKTLDGQSQKQIKTKAKKIPPKLTPEQDSTIKSIKKSTFRTFLIHGNTGSGKTRVYIELIRSTLKELKSVIVLVPEIGLSPQITQSFRDYFPNKVIEINSSLTEKTKRENWQKILCSKNPVIIVGPRSALFMPVDNLGLIIVDEAHDDSYKQESAPFYQTTRVAAKLSEITNSKLVMGTATPLISDYYMFEERNIPILRMIKSAVSSTDIKPLIQIVDLADKSSFTQSPRLSDLMLRSIEESLRAGEQSLIFLNRRGTAIVILCQNCGWKAVCPNCDTSLTYHQDQHSVICHSCGYKNKFTSTCPTCGSHDIIYHGVGTKAIEAELKKIFPTSKIKRFDKDNLKKDSLSENYINISQGKTDIIIGTQIITKGLDLPKLTTVGIVMADQNLAFPDFSSEEKNYQTLLQVIGRVGRGHKDSSRIIIQTYNPNSKTILAAISKNYETFYNDQLYSRKKYLFPPFVFLLKIYCKKSTSKKAMDSCIELTDKIKNLHLKVNISDPTPAFHEKVGGKYVWQFVIKSRARGNLLDIISHIPNDWFFDIDPVSLL